VTFEYRLRMAEGERDFEARLVPLRAGERLTLVRDGRPARHWDKEPRVHAYGHHLGRRR
jgi:hypothetical protein